MIASDTDKALEHALAALRLIASGDSADWRRDEAHAALTFIAKNYQRAVERAA